nr:MAG TPA: hypothetical protein [Caudoviricetes sp.]
MSTVRKNIKKPRFGGVFAFLGLPIGGLFYSPRSERTHGNKRGLNVRSCFWHYGCRWWPYGCQCFWYRNRY